MPLLNFANRRSQSAGNDGVVGTLASRIGNAIYGQGVFLTGTTQPIQVEAGNRENPTIREMLLNNTDIAAWLAAEGRVFYAADADQNDLVTGQTSFADTTPTFLLDVPANTVAIPLMVSLGQTSTVAGGDISVIIEIDDAKRYSSSGTSETRFSANTRRSPAAPTPQCTLYSGATAATGYGTRIMGVTVGADVSPAEGISNELIWTPTGPDFLVGPASFLVYTYAGTTGPTWFWTMKWAELPVARLGF